MLLQKGKVLQKIFGAKQKKKKNSSKILQDQKTLVSAFVYFV